MDSSAFKRALIEFLGNDIYLIPLSRRSDDTFIVQSNENLFDRGIEKVPLSIVAEIAFSYKIETLSLIPTGDIVLRPKGQNTINAILEQYNSVTELIESTVHNTHLLKAKRLADVIQIANNIYESGHVEWCHPDFIVPIILH